jgi:hypothetical protein
MKWLLRMEAFGAGCWLGLAQVSLGFAVMAGAGASALLFFLLTGVWIAGGVVGMTQGRRLGTGRLLLGSVVLVAAARVCLWLAPFWLASTVLGLAAGFLPGAYSGSFIRSRSERFGKISSLLFNENNGFITGYLLAAGLLFVDVFWLDAAAVLLAATLLTAEFTKAQPFVPHVDGHPGVAVAQREIQS